MNPLVNVTPGQQTRMLVASTTAFTVCFAVWTIFSIIGIQIKRDLGLNETEFGLLVGTPILTGSLVRLMLGIWTDRYGGRLVFTLVMLSASAATFFLSTVKTYEMFLVAALCVGMAGGSFAVGIAYTSRWFPKEKQGTALGIFGMGNVGSAVTKFIAPFVMVAYGWKMVALVWAGVLAVTAILFWLTTDEDPVIANRKKHNIQSPSIREQLEPLKNIQVWRFSLYYFFVFGAFVALALWLPRYYVGCYGLSIESAGMLGAAYSIPGSLFRAVGGVLSDKIGARRIMYMTFGCSMVFTFLLSYPATDFVIHGIKGDVVFSISTGLVMFSLLTFGLGVCAY